MIIFQNIKNKRGLTSLIKKESDKMNNIIEINKLNKTFKIKEKEKRFYRKY